MPIAMNLDRGFENEMDIVNRIGAVGVARKLELLVVCEVAIDALNLFVELIAQNLALALIVANRRELDSFR